MMTPVCPWILNMINDVVLLRFWARPPPGIKRYSSYILLLLLLHEIYNIDTYATHFKDKFNRCARENIMFIMPLH